MEKISIRWIGALLLAVILAAALHQGIKWDALSRFVKIQVLAEVDQDVLTHLRYRSGLTTTPSAGALGDAEVRDAEALEDALWTNSPLQALYRGKVRTLEWDIANRIAPVQSFVTQSPRVVALHAVVFKSFYGSAVRYDAQKLSEHLQPLNGERMQLVGDVLKVESRSDKPIELIFKDPVRAQNSFLLYGVPLLLGGLAFFWALHKDIGTIPAIGDIARAGVDRSKYRIELDGLRGLAALLVLCEHTWQPFLGAGRTGVWLFFILSGYLLSLPFVARPERAVNAGYLIQYYFRRLSRIVPMYWFTVVLLFGVTGHYDKLFNHLLFFSAEGYLWTIPQEVFFYLLLPALMVLALIVMRINKWLTVAVFASLAIALVFNRNWVPVSIYALGRPVPPFVGWFLLGVALAYLNPEALRQRLSLSAFVERVLGWLGLGLLFMILFLSSYSGSHLVLDIPDKRILTLFYGHWFGIACAVLLFCVLFLPCSALSRLMSLKVLRAVGVVGYSYYLLHPLVIDLIHGVSEYYFNYRVFTGWSLLLVAGLLTWVTAAFTYSLIERPFLRRSAY